MVSRLLPFGTHDVLLAAEEIYTALTQTHDQREARPRRLMP